MAINPYFDWLHFSLIFLVVILLTSCRGNDQDPDIQQYIFIAHSYDWKAPDGNRVDPRLEKIDWSPFDQIWLGGDICARSSQSAATLDYLDRLFGISQPTTHWALGNHDINQGDPSLIRKKTNRPSFYHFHQDGITLLVLDTNPGHPQLPPPDSSALCHQLNRQFHLLKSVCDTIQQSAYMVILHHHALLTNQMTEGKVDVREKFHYVLPELPVSCTPPGNFEELVYPLLIGVQRSGIQVVLIGGDVGMRAKRFEFRTKEGIWFLGSGINNSMDLRYRPEYVTNMNPDSLLLFEYNRKVRKLSWKFLPLEGLEF